MRPSFCPSFRALRRPSRGVTLIEVMMALAVLGLLLAAGLPTMAGYATNSRLRAAADQIQAAAHTARAEAIKRNAQVRVTATATTVRLEALEPDTGAVSETLHTWALPSGVGMTAATATYDSAGRLTPFGTEVQLTVASATAVCGGDVRCPTVHLSAGGAVRLCPAEGCL